MNKVLIALGIIVVAVIVFFFARNLVVSRLANEGTQGVNPESTVKINNQTFKVAVAQSSTEKQIGLSETVSLPEDQGMIFPFEAPGYYSFWMKNMDFPIDIIYLNNNKVVTIHKNVQPPAENQENIPVYRPDEPATAVLEINAGLADKYQIKDGSTVEMSL